MSSVSKKPNGNFKILLVEDNPSNQFLMNFCLAKTRYIFDLAENGQEAVGKFEQGAYDLLLMDINMPVMDGYEATQMIRQFEKNNQRDETPIIALTANVSPADQKKCIQSGFTGAIAKPFQIQEFLNSLKQIAERILLGEKPLSMPIG
jgi:CheY-like chemotaxis protein